jgi:hypothetical protein
MDHKELIEMLERKIEDARRKRLREAMNGLIVCKELKKVEKVVLESINEQIQVVEKHREDERKYVHELSVAMKAALLKDKQE